MGLAGRLGKLSKLRNGVAHPDGAIVQDILGCDLKPHVQFGDDRDEAPADKDTDGTQFGDADNLEIKDTEAKFELVHFDFAPLDRAASHRQAHGSASDANAASGRTLCKVGDEEISRMKPEVPASPLSIQRRLQLPALLVEMPWVAPFWATLTVQPPKS